MVNQGQTVILSWGCFCPQGTPGSVWRHLCVPAGQTATGTWWVVAWDVLDSLQGTELAALRCQRRWGCQTLGHTQPSTGFQSASRPILRPWM